MPDHLILDWPTERICILRLNRPEAYNALNRKLTEELRSAVADLPSSDARVMILTPDPGRSSPYLSAKRLRNKAEADNMQANCSKTGLGAPRARPGGSAPAPPSNPCTMWRTTIS